MHHSGSIIIVPLYLLEDESIPKAFKDYVNKYFEKREIFGEVGMIAFQTTSMSAHCRYSSKAVAPAHTVDLDCFRDDLPENASLYDWMQQNMELFCVVPVSWEDSCSESLLD